jgi:hypothetical protein
MVPSLAFADLGTPATGYKTMLSVINTDQYKVYVGPDRMIVDIINPNGLTMVSCYYSLDGTLDYNQLNKRNIPSGYDVSLFRKVFSGVGYAIESSFDGNFYVITGTFDQNKPFVAYSTKEGMEWIIQHPNYDKEILSKLPQRNTVYN